MFGLGHGHSLSLAALNPLSVPFVGPLDAYTTALEVALLPFRGFSGYAGDGFTIRDTDDDSTQDVGFESNGDLSAFSVVGNPAIAPWYDQSGHGYNAISPTNARQPFLTPNIVNGQAVARMDGVDDSLVSTFTFVGGYTVYLVLRKRSAPAATDTVAVIRGSSLNYSKSGTNGGWYQKQGLARIALGGDVTQWSLHSYVAEASLNAVNAINNTPPVTCTRVNFSNLTIGSGSGGDGDVAAALVYSAQHDDTTRQAIQSILADKFGITLA